MFFPFRKFTIFDLRRGDSLLRRFVTAARALTSERSANSRRVSLRLHFKRRRGNKNNNNMKTVGERLGFWSRKNRFPVTAADSRGLPYGNFPAPLPRIRVLSPDTCYIPRGTVNATGVCDITNFKLFPRQINEPAKLSRYGRRAATERMIFYGAPFVFIHFFFFGNLSLVVALHVEKHVSAREICRPSA